MLIRPKSITTVVAILLSTPVMSSVPTLASVRYSSVCNGMISLHEPTRVVFPTPNPPATRILSANGRGRSECPKSIDHRLQDAVVGWVDLRVGLEGRDEVGLQQVPDQDPHDADREVEPGRDLGDGERGAG